MGVVEKKHGRTEVPEREPFTRVFFSALTRKRAEMGRERRNRISGTAKLETDTLHGYLMIHRHARPKIHEP